MGYKLKEDSYSGYKLKKSSQMHWLQIKWRQPITVVTN